MPLKYLSIVSPTRLGTLERDGVEGVVRIPISDLKYQSRRNSFVSIIASDSSGKELGRLVRIVRGIPPELTPNAPVGSIAIDYDDRVALGIGSLSADYIIEIKFRNAIYGALPYLWNHRSPTTRAEARVSLVLFLLGILVGILPGALFF